MLAQALDGVDVDQPAAADDRHPIRNVLHLVERVRRQEDRRARGDRFAQQGPELLLEDRIETARRLVEHEQRRSDA